MKVKITNRKTKVKISKKDLWDLDVNLAMVILPALVKFRKSATCYPSEYGNPTLNDELSMQNWKNDLDTMIKSFKECITYDYHDYNRSQEWQRGIDLFAKHYKDLWQ